MNALRLLFLSCTLAAAAFVGCEKHDFESTKRLHGGHGDHGDDHGGDGHGGDHGKDGHGDDHGKGAKGHGDGHGKQEGEAKPVGEARATGL